MDSQPYEHLFTPFDLAGKTFKNRIIHASILTSLVKDQKVTDELIQYSLNRAKGGASAIVTEPFGMISQHQSLSRRVDAFTSANEHRLAHWADQIRSYNCHLIGQIQDSGRGRHVPQRNFGAIGASALPDDLSWSMPHELTTTEVTVLIQEFARSAARLKDCGFSGVELSSGHGHLFQQFLSAQSNHRTDQYGGSFNGRLRLLVDLIEQIRHECADDFVVGLKLVGIDGVLGGIDLSLGAEIVDAITQLSKIDYLCFAQGSHHRSLEMHVPDGHYPRVPYRNIIKHLKGYANGVAVAALARITDPAEAQRLLSDGVADFVALGRALIADPQWPEKARTQQAHDIRYCVSGNRCWKTVTTQNPIACDNNPRVGQVDEVVVLQPYKRRKSERVVVVGAGVAGLEAAWVAAARGFDVTLFNSSEEVGGSTRLHAMLPGSEGYASIYDYQHTKLTQLGVHLLDGHKATLEDILSQSPATVILATGATMVWPACLPQELCQDILDLRQTVMELLKHQNAQAGSAVLFDMDHTEGTYASAELLSQLFERTYIVTPRATIADEVPLVTRQGIYRRCHEKNITLVTLAQPCWNERVERHAELELHSVYGGIQTVVSDLALFTYATPRYPNLDLYDALVARRIATILVGDCRVARWPLEAVSEGYKAAISL